MDSSSGYKLTVLFIVAIVVPATVLSLVSIGAIQRERAAFRAQAAQRLQERGRELFRSMEAELSAPARRAEEAATAAAPDGPFALAVALRRLTAPDGPFIASAVLGDQGALLGPPAAPRTSPGSELARLDELFRPAEDLEHRAQAVDAALHAYERIGRAHPDDGRVQVEVLAAEARLHRAAAPMGGDGQPGVSDLKALEAYRTIIDRYDLVQDRAGAFVSLGARLEVAAFWRRLGHPAEEEATLSGLLSLASEHARVLGPDVARYYRRVALARLAELAPERASALAEQARETEAALARTARFAEAIRQSGLEPELRRMQAALSDGDGPGRPRYVPSLAGSGGPTVYAIPARHERAERPWLALLEVGSLERRERRLADALGAARQGDDGRFLLARLDAPAPEGEEVLFERALPAPLAHLALRGTLADAGDDEPFGVLGEKLRVSAIGLALLGLVIGAVIVTLAVRREMKAAQLKSDFVTTVTHELKTPLTSIGMFAETLLMGRVESKEEEKECIEIIVKETERLSRLIERVLTFSKIEAQKKRFQLRLVDLNKLVGETVALFERQMRGADRPATIEVKAVHELPEVLCDRGAVQEVLLNLLHNAYKYGTKPRLGRASVDPDAPPEEGSRIQVTLLKRRGWAGIAVRDWGIGIHWREQRKIFRKFYRANDVLTREVEGSGIGLTLARSIARAHRGDITVRSKPGHGSTFSLWLPR